MTKFFKYMVLGLALSAAVMPEQRAWSFEAPREFVQGLAIGSTLLAGLFFGASYWQYRSELERGQLKGKRKPTYFDLLASTYKPTQYEKKLEVMQADSMAKVEMRRNNQNGLWSNMCKFFKARFKK